jgi:hypothetical protein
MGESYIRCYVWAENEILARELAIQAFQKRSEYASNPLFAEISSIFRLFSASDPSFVTKVSDSGFNL